MKTKLAKQNKALITDINVETASWTYLYQCD